MDGEDGAEHPQGAPVPAGGRTGGHAGYGGHGGLRGPRLPPLDTSRGWSQHLLHTQPGLGNEAGKGTGISRSPPVTLLPAVLRVRAQRR